MLGNRLGWRAFKHILKPLGNRREDITDAVHHYSKYGIVYAVNVNQTNISYTNGVPVCKACIIIW